MFQSDQASWSPWESAEIVEGDWTVWDGWLGGNCIWISKEQVQIWFKSQLNIGSILMTIFPLDCTFVGSETFWPFCFIPIITKCNVKQKKKGLDFITFYNVLNSNLEPSGANLTLNFCCIYSLRNSTIQWWLLITFRITIKALTIICEVLYNLAPACCHSCPTLHALAMHPTLTFLRSSYRPNFVLPQGLCLYCFLCLGCSFPPSFLA